ncbi:MAG TPA: hypothetical protein VN688_00220 [Gemmataceae bacterium]|nr:hypothetical protein [Gemmataceae bacterium]
MTDSLLDDTFHFSALRAYMEVWCQTGQFPPDSETTRRRAYQLYEEALAEKNRDKQPQNSDGAMREAGPDCLTRKAAGAKDL